MSDLINEWLDFQPTLRELLSFFPLKGGFLVRWLGRIWLRQGWYKIENLRCIINNHSIRNSNSAVTGNYEKKRTKQPIAIPHQEGGKLSTTILSSQLTLSTYNHSSFDCYMIIFLKKFKTTSIWCSIPDDVDNFAWHTLFVNGGISACWRMWWEDPGCFILPHPIRKNEFNVSLHALFKS